MLVQAAPPQCGAACLVKIHRHAPSIAEILRILELMQFSNYAIWLRQNYLDAHLDD